MPCKKKPNGSYMGLNIPVLATAGFARGRHRGPSPSSECSTYQLRYLKTPRMSTSRTPACTRGTVTTGELTPTCTNFPRDLVTCTQECQLVSITVFTLCPTSGTHVSITHTPYKYVVLREESLLPIHVTRNFSNINGGV